MPPSFFSYYSPSRKFLQEKSVLRLSNTPFDLLSTGLHQFDHCHFSSVTTAGAGTGHSGVAAFIRFVDTVNG